jgi:High potential iron-sulfur protein
MNHGIARRTFIKAAVFAAAVPATGVLQQAVAAAPLPLVDANDPTAKALGYVIDATKVDVKSNPTYKPGQKCTTCAQFQGKPADKQAACALFLGKQVHAAGWCKAWGQKPGA